MKRTALNLALTGLLLAALTALAKPGASHEELNPVYRQLRSDGLQYTARVKIPLPPPTMADGLRADQQYALIKKLAGNDFSMDQLLADSVVADEIIRIESRITPTDPLNPPRRADVWFIAYGDLKKIASKDFLDRLVSMDRGKGQGKSLDDKDLLKRGIKIAEADKKHEGYGHGQTDLFDLVRIKATGRSYWSQTADSVVTASIMDPRFLKDAEFPNRWHSLIGTPPMQKLGPPQPYQGLGFYMKITRMERPAEALFVEAHIGFAEPSGWFKSKDLLRPKLTRALEVKVRDIRRELAKIR